MTGQPRQPDGRFDRVPGSSPGASILERHPGGRALLDEHLSSLSGAERVAVEARLGFDPAQAPDDQVERALEVVDRVFDECITDLPSTVALREQPAARQRYALSVAGQSTAGVDNPSLAAAAAARRVVDDVARGDVAALAALGLPAAACGGGCCLHGD